MKKFAEGGVIVPTDGQSHTITIRRVGQCVHGFCLYEIDGDPQHIVSADEIRQGDTRKLTCGCGGRAAS